MTKAKEWTKEELAKLRELYPTTPACDLADVFKCSSGVVSYQARLLGLKKDQSFRTQNYIGRYTLRRGKYNIYKR